MDKLLFFCIGVVLACFHDSGGHPSSRDFCNIRSRGTSRISYSSLNLLGLVLMFFSISFS